MTARRVLGRGEGQPGRVVVKPAEILRHELVGPIDRVPGDDGPLTRGRPPLAAEWAVPGIGGCGARMEAVEFNCRSLG